MRGRAAAALAGLRRLRAGRGGRTLRLPLSFLGPGRHLLTEYADGPQAADDPKQLAVSERAVGRGDTLTLGLAPSGGYAARLAPASGPR